MATKQLGFVGPPQMAITVGADTPNPGINGVQVWSTTANALVHWDSNSWELVGGTGGNPTEDSIFNPVDFSAPHGFTWLSVGDNSNNDIGSITYTMGTAVSKDPGITNTILDTVPFLIQSSGTVTYSVAGAYNNNHQMKVGDAFYGGFIFECLCGFTPSANGQMFIGMQSTNLLYSDSPSNTVSAIGIGGFGSDDLNTGFRIYFGNGTTFNSSVFINRPAGTRNDPLYKVYIRVPGNSNIAKLWIIDYGIENNPEGITILNGYEIDISTLPKTKLLEATLGYGNGSTTTNKVFKSSYLRVRHFIKHEIFNEAAVNILGNATTADSLNNLNGIPQGGATTNQVLSWNGTAWAPATGGGGGSEDPIILDSTDATAPGADQVKIFRRPVGGRQMPAFVGPSGVDTAIQPSFARNRISMILPTGNATTLTVLGIASPTATGTATTANVLTTNLFTRMKKLEYLVTTASTTAVAGWRNTAAQFTIGASESNLGGFHYVCTFGPATGVSNTTKRCFVGMTNSTAAPTNVEPSTITNIVGCGWDSGDTNIQMFHRGTGAITKINTGIPIPDTDRTSVLELSMFSPPGTTQQVKYEVRNLTTDTSFTGTISTNMPTNVTLLVSRGWMSVGTTNSVVGIGLMGLYIETDY